MHVFVNATYIADLLLSPSTPPRSRIGDALQSSEVLSKLSAIMAGDSTTEGEGWPKGLAGVEVCGPLRKIIFRDNKHSNGKKNKC